MGRREVSVKEGQCVYERHREMTVKLTSAGSHTGGCVGEWGKGGNSVPPPLV